MIKQALLSSSIALLVILRACLPASIQVGPVTSLPSLPQDAVLTVAVVPDPSVEYEVSAYALERLATDLEATGLFRSVQVGDSDDADILAVTREVWEGPFCGNPLILSMLTFGLIPTTQPRYVNYGFDFTGRSGEGRIPFSHHFSTKEKFGLIAVPMRLSRNWAKSPESGTPEPFIRELRSNLLPLHDRLMELGAAASAAAERGE